MIVVGGIVLLGCCCNLGCGITAQVDRERQAAVEFGKAITLKVIDKAKLDQSLMGASAQVVNPEYKFDFVAGTGIYCSGTVRAIGVDVKAKLDASGQGMVEPDADLRARIDEILSRRDIAEVERKTLILRAISTWLGKDAASTESGSTEATQPSP